ncbi:MAG: ClpX C4-type zinc finger protein [Caulobacteraceae bacterium]
MTTAPAMPPPLPRYEKPSTVFCSFCLKSEAEVAQLVAGPANIFICDECVAMSVEYMAGRTPDRSKYTPPDRLPTERLVAQLKPVEQSLQGKGSQLQWLVDTLRARQVSWAAIGEALGVSRQSAWERFSRPALDQGAKP